jgi:allantoicase
MKRTDLDLAGRALGGSARYVGDEFFAACEALLMPGPAIHDTTTFGPHGKISPWCRVRRRAGTPPKPTGSTSTRRFTHVRLNIYPDGGVARLRVNGSAVPDPRVLGDRIDLAAIHHGGDIAECSDMFYSDPDGGFSRLHLLGQLSPQALSAAISQWLLRLTAQASSRVLLGGAPVRELTEQATAEPGLVARRPRGNAPGAGRAAPCRTSVTMADISAMSRRCNIRRLRSAC